MFELLLVFLHAIVGAMWIGGAIESFRKGHYYWFGFQLTFMIGDIMMLIKFIFNV